MLTLYGYWRSGTSYRTRIALNLKGISYQQVTLDLRKSGHRSASYLTRQPQGLVPAVDMGDDCLIQSPAIIEWLEERYPQPPLLPTAQTDRAIVRAMAAIIGCDIHPINNLRVLDTLRAEFSATDELVRKWAARWIVEGFAALETLVSRHGGAFAYGDTPSFADVYLVPQAYSAERFGISLKTWPKLERAVENARCLPAVASAAPELQPDAD